MSVLKKYDPNTSQWLPVAVGATGPQGESWQETFETVSKNISAYPATLAYSGGNLSTITYDLGSGLSVVKSFAYTGGNLTSITLSGDTPGGISLTKTLTYTGSDLTGITYGGA